MCTALRLAAVACVAAGAAMARPEGTFTPATNANIAFSGRGFAFPNGSRQFDYSGSQLAFVTTGASVVMDVTVVSPATVPGDVFDVFLDSIFATRLQLVSGTRLYPLFSLWPASRLVQVIKATEPAWCVSA